MLSTLVSVSMPCRLRFISRSLELTSPLVGSPDGSTSDRWQELGDGIFRRRYEFLDQNIGLVIGSEAVLLIDTRSHPGHAEEVLSDVRLVTPLPVGWVFNTHYHWDHTFGNQVFEGSAIWGHVNCRSELMERGLTPLDELLVDYPQEADGFRKVVVTPPTEVFDDRATIDLGNRIVEMSYHGRGHTNSDAVLHADDVTFAGDLIEEGAPPSFRRFFPDLVVRHCGALGGRGAEHRRSRPRGCRRRRISGCEPDSISAGSAVRPESALDAGLAVDEIDLKGSPYPEDSAREALERAYLELGPSGRDFAGLRSSPSSGTGWARPGRGTCFPTGRIRRDSRRGSVIRNRLICPIFMPG